MWLRARRPAMERVLGDVRGHGLGPICLKLAMHLFLIASCS